MQQRNIVSLQERSAIVFLFMVSKLEILRLAFRSISDDSETDGDSVDLDALGGEEKELPAGDEFGADEEDESSEPSSE